MRFTWHRRQSAALKFMVRHAANLPVSWLVTWSIRLVICLLVICKAATTFLAVARCATDALPGSSWPFYTYLAAEEVGPKGSRKNQPTFDMRRGFQICLVKVTNDLPSRRYACLNYKAAAQHSLLGQLGGSGRKCHPIAHRIGPSSLSKWKQNAYRYWKLPRRVAGGKRLACCPNELKSL